MSDQIPSLYNNHMDNHMNTTTTEKFLLIRDFDLAWDDTSETFQDLLAEIGQKFPMVFIRIRQMVGSGGGWPSCDIVVPNSQFDALLETLGYDSDDFEDFREDAVAL